MDFAKMLQELGVSHAITVDLQRPGQGQEACYFNNSVPLETVLTHDLLVDYFVKNIRFENKSIIVISPNSECVRKARNFQLGFQNAFPTLEVKMAVFNSDETGSGPTDPNKSTPNNNHVTIVRSQDFGGKNMSDIPVQAVFEKALSLLS